jgi:hypothetical protein
VDGAVQELDGTERVGALGMGAWCRVLDTGYWMLDAVNVPEYG